MAGIGAKVSEVKYAKHERKHAKGSNVWPKISRRAFSKFIRHANRLECRSARLDHND